ncbi:DUF6153 family protein [Rhodococcus sp. Q]|uniref:DUF6153 family protein n=1 Tax=Rhodococcus sp. Q TaxID=2502252 RepID=UPI0010F7BA88|nr:DUF6153 family protein [Rhodococcus sp. Q]
MTRDIQSSTGPRRAVLLLAVILGILAMHHVATAMPVSSHDSAPGIAAAAVVEAVTDPAMPDHEGGGHGGDQHMFAACLAVVSAGVVLVLALLLFGTFTGTAIGGDRRRVIPVHSGRGPPFARPTSTRLATLCILRV